MCCLLERRLPKRDYSYTSKWTEPGPKRIHSKTEHYFGNERSGVVYGKLARSEKYIRWGRKSAGKPVVIRVPVARALLGQFPSTKQDEIKFNSLIQEWKRQTGMFSLVQQKVLHPAYLEIIGMSWRALPYLIKELGNGASHWFPALRAIAGETGPKVSPANFSEAVRIWTQWWEKMKTNVGMDIDRAGK